jgi:hypothetical protein
LNSPVSSGNQTSLVFCHDKVDPDLVTQLLDLSPSEAQHVGDIGRYEGALSVAVSVWLYEQSPGDRSNESQLTHLRYRTGELILAGDVVEYHGDRGHVEYVVNGPTGDSEMDWNFRTNGTGVMVVEPKHFGRVYITDNEHDEHLAFLSRTPDVKA